MDKRMDKFVVYKILSFMDTYFRYKQILMHTKDHNKTSFMSEHANYKCNVRPFGLKNASVTY